MCLQLRDCLEQLNGSNHFNVKLCTTSQLSTSSKPIVLHVAMHPQKAPQSGACIHCIENLRTYIGTAVKTCITILCFFAVRRSPRGRGKRGGLYQAPSMRGAHDPGTAKVSGEFWSTSFLSIAHFQVIG